MASEKSFVHDREKGRVFYHTIYRAMNGQTSKTLSKEEASLVWEILKSETPYATGSSQSSGIYVQQYTWRGIQYEALWAPSVMIDETPSLIEEKVPMESPSARESRIEKERLTKRVKVSCTDPQPSAL